MLEKLVVFLAWLRLWGWFGRREADEPIQRNLRIDDIGPRPFASQSTTNLPDNQMRRPLFGEILAMSPGNPDLGYGTPSNARRRRGSEGSIHSPNPMFPQERGRPEIFPSFPSAWYLGATLVSIVIKPYLTHAYHCKKIRSLARPQTRSRSSRNQQLEMGQTSLAHGHECSGGRPQKTMRWPSFGVDASRQLSASAISWSRMLEYVTDVPEYAGFV